MSKKFLTVILALLVMLAALPMGAVSFAAENLQEELQLAEKAADAAEELGVASKSVEYASSDYPYTDAYDTDAYTSDKIGYCIMGGKVIITDYQGSAANLTIPSTIKGKKVTHIENGAFSNCLSLKTVTVPSGVIQIGEYCFAGCENLTKVTLPSSLISIGEGAFSLCYSLTGINIPASVGVIPLGSFYSCVSLKSIIIPNGISKIDEQAFAGCVSLKSVKIPGSVKSIGYGAFIVCESLSSVTISDGVQEVLEGAFFECPEMKSVYIPASVKTIGEQAFGYIIYDIDDMTDTLNSGFYITGNKNSEAETYAKRNGIIFKEQVLLNKTSINIGVGESYTLTAKNSSGYKWSTSDSSIVTVSGGKITAKKAGTAKITVKAASGTSSTCIVSVKPAPTKVTLNKTSITLGVGETFDLDSTITGGSASYSRSYTTSDSSVATAPGSIINAKKVGTATITVKTYNDKTATCKVTVKPAPTKVTLNKTSITLGVGETYDLNSNVNSGSASYVRNYTSSNSSVATAPGSIINAKKVGTATITVKTYNGKTATCIVSVKPAPTKVTLNKTSITLGVGETFDLNSTVNSGSASYVRYWSTSNSSVATAPGSIINAKKVGTATITVKTYNGKTATCKVTVKPAPTKVTLNKTSLTLKVGQTFDLDSTLNNGAASHSRSYTTSDSSVATVPNSIVTAKKPGTAIITVKTFNGKTATCRVTVKAA